MKIIHVYQHGGIGDQLLSLPWYKLLHDRGLKIKVYTLFTEVARLLMPWALSVEPRDRMARENPECWLDFSDMIRFRGNICLLPVQDWITHYNETHKKEWAHLIDSHPFSGNAVGRKCVGLGVHRWDYGNYLIGAEYTKFSIDVDYSYVIPPDIITVHNGFDTTHRMDVSMKSWPLDYWTHLVSQLKKAGYRVMQLGALKDVGIPGVSYDMRGKTTFRECLSILGQSKLHIDTEGGLVHARHMMGKKSVVLFGPTDIEFFGYPENINIGPQMCGNCWWKKPDWMRNCVEGYEGEYASCMTSILPNHVFTEVLKCQE